LVISVINPGVADLVSRVSQIFGEMPHGRKDEGNLFLVMTDVAGLRHDFAHQHDVTLRVDAIERRYLRRELIA